MGLVTRAVTRALPALSLTAAYRTSPRSDKGAMAIATTIGRRVTKTTPQIYRNWAIHAPFVRVAMDIRIGQAMLGEWDLVPYSRDGKTPDPGLMRRIRELLTVPNLTGEVFGEFVSRWSEDILTLDAGTVEKERMYNGEIAYLWPTDGARVGVDRFWDGSPTQPRYYWLPNPTTEIPMLNRDLIYTMLHPRSYEPVGISILETIKMSIEAELSGSLFNARTITQAAPDGIMDLGENVRPEQVTAFRSFFEQEIAGKGMIGFWGGTKNSKFINFRGSNKDAQFIEFLQWEARKIALGFQLSPQDLGFLSDVNRANAEVQQQNTEDRGTRTFLGKIQNAVTAEVCWDEGYGGPKNNIAFRYRAVSDRASLAKAQEMKLALAGMPWETVNGGRIKLNLPPIGDPDDPDNPFNKLMANTPLGLATIDLVPNAKEIARINAPKPAQLGAGGDAGSKGPASKAEKAYEIMTTTREPDLSLVAELVESRMRKQSIAAASPVPNTPPDGEEDEVSRRERFMEFLRALDDDDRETEDRLLALVEERVTSTVTSKFADLETMVRSAMERPIELNVEAPKVDVHVPAPMRTVRETKFLTDATGHIIGKRETERPVSEESEDRNG